MMPAWYFDALEVTRCTVIEAGNSIAVEIETRGQRKVVSKSRLAPTFDLARIGRLKLIAEMIEEKRRVHEELNREILSLLGLIDDAIRDDESAHVDDEGGQQETDVSTNQKGVTP